MVFFCVCVWQDGEPCKVGVAMTDLSTGLYAHGAIMAALLHRRNTGQGQHIDCNLFATQVCEFCLSHHQTYLELHFRRSCFFLSSTISLLFFVGARIVSSSRYTIFDWQ